jgi:hypothetical protein
MEITRAAEKIFAACLGLYPSRFRAEFGGEIREVFSESLRQAERRGLLSVLAVGLREISDLPINVISEYWEEYHMRNLQLSQPFVRPLWWGAVGFGLSAALADLINAVIALQPSGLTGPFAPDALFGIGMGLYALLGGLGGLLFALVCRQSAESKRCFMAGSLGFLIGHLLSIPVMVASGVLLFLWNPSNNAALLMTIVTRWIDLFLMVSLTGLFVGWLNKDLRRALTLAGFAALGTVSGGLLGLGFCGLLARIGPSAVGQSVITAGWIFAVNSVAGIIGGALLGGAIGRGGASRDAALAAV